MKKYSNIKDPSQCRKQSASSSIANVRVGVVLTSALLAATPVHAVDFDTGNTDVKLNWTNTVSFNLATRLKNRDALIDSASGGTFSQSNALFRDRGDIIAKRADLLSEINFSYLNRFGARLSGAAWYDAAYGDQAASGLSANGSVIKSFYVNNEFTPIVKRFYAGPSGEFLDAYVYARFDVGPVPLDVRVGKQAVIWGESLFGSTNAIAYSQAPSDGRKPLANPAAAAKETALATKQISFVAQVLDDVTVAGHYAYEWQPNRSPEGGTYFAAADLLFAGPNVGRSAPVYGNKGDVGVSLKWMPEFMNSGAFGLYYRKFDEKNPWAAQPAAPGATGSRLVYAPNVELFGLSMTKLVASASVGTEISYRKNMPLVTRGGTPDGMGASGETLHALLNVSKAWGNSSWFSTASLAAEVGISHLVKVTSNAQFYRNVGNVAVGCAIEDVVGGCAAKTFYTAGAQFTPEWQQIIPGVNLTAPLFYSKNFKGNAPTNSGGVEGFQTLKVGLSALVNQKHKVDLAATFFKGKTDNAGAGSTPRVSGAPYNDKAYLALTYTTYF